MSEMPTLQLQDITVRFGGLTAVNGLSLEAPPGRVTGLIGPNGAGKSTTFNACTGMVESTGTVTLGDGRLERLSTARRAQAGLGRTFQRMELVDTMTVFDNVRLGAEAVRAGRRPWSQLASGRAANRELDRITNQAIHRCGIRHLRGERAAELSTGQGRLLELARVIASGFRFFLLDEPSSGLDVEETVEFGHILDSVVAETGVGVLLVEHDMALVRRLCTYIYVLDFGELIYEGEAADVLASEQVRAAYLGSEADDQEAA